MAAERRRASRFASQLSVRVVNRQLAVPVSGLEMLSSNVSRTGLQVACPQMRFASIEKAVRSGQLEAEIELPDTLTLNATCGVAYTSDYGDEILIGLRLERFTESGASEWERYIADLEAARAR